MTELIRVGAEIELAHFSRPGFLGEIKAKTAVVDNVYRKYQKFLT
jgi:hypothetical protein